MDRPKRNAKTVSGIQKVIAPVAGIPKIADDPWPSCQNHVNSPNVAANDTFDLEPRHFALMRAIALNEGQSQHVLAAGLEVPTSSMVSLVDDLEARGIVERRAHVTDRRARTLHLTPTGRSQLAAAGGVAGGLEGVLMEGIPEADRIALVSMLKRVADNLGLTDGVHPNLRR